MIRYSISQASIPTTKFFLEKLVAIFVELNENIGYITLYQTDILLEDIYFSITVKDQLRSQLRLHYTLGNERIHQLDCMMIGYFLI